MSVVVAYCPRSDFASIGKCGKWQTNGKGGEAAKSLNIILQCVGLCLWPVHCFWAPCVQVKVYNDVTLGNGPNIV